MAFSYLLVSLPSSETISIPSREHIAGYNETVAYHHELLLHIPDRRLQTSSSRSLQISTGSYGTIKYPVYRICHTNIASRHRIKTGDTVGASPCIADSPHSACPYLLHCIFAWLLKFTWVHVNVPHEFQSLHVFFNSVSSLRFWSICSLPHCAHHSLLGILRLLIQTARAAHLSRSVSASRRHASATGRLEKHGFQSNV